LKDEPLGTRKYNRKPKATKITNLLFLPEISSLIAYFRSIVPLTEKGNMHLKMRIDVTLKQNLQSNTKQLSL